MKKIYKGIIKEKDYGDGEAIFLEGMDKPLVLGIQDDREKHGEYLTVKYYVSDKEASEDKLIEEFLKSIIGGDDIRFQVAYSDSTGYLWTDEDLMVGGHDIINEIRNNEGKYLHMEIDFSKSEKK